MDDNKIVIKRKSLLGIKKPLLSIEGEFENNSVQPVLICDGKNFSFNQVHFGNDKKFFMNAFVPKESKSINVLLCDDNGKALCQVHFKNSLFRLYLASGLKKILRVFNKLNICVHLFFGGIRILWKRHHFLVPPVMLKQYFMEMIRKIKRNALSPFYDPNNVFEYSKWIEKHEGKTEYKELNYKPLISFLIPVYNIGSSYLSKCLDSILSQKYDNFEVCLVDDCSTNNETKETLSKYENKDSRIKVKYRKENGHISVATNDCFEMASGEYVALMDDDDEITEDALYLVAKAINDNPDIDFLYSDEDKIDDYGRRCYPHFKPDWSPDTILSMNYICHLTVIKKSLFREAGGFRKGYEGAQDYDLFLRATEKAKHIHHIPRILYHWRMVEGSTAKVLSSKNYALERGKTALEDHFARNNISAHVEIDEKTTYYKVFYETPGDPLVSIIIPTKDLADVTEKCLSSLFSKTTYKNYEVILVNNNSEKPETFKLFEKYKSKYSNFRVIDALCEFNYSKINNLAINEAAGEYICLLNNDTEILNGNWLSIMLGYAMQPHIGTVGAKLFYPDMTVQHAGTIMGLGGVASHAYLGSSKNDTGLYGRLCVPYNYAANTAACLVVSKEKFESVGGLEEDLKVAYNDVDFNMKLLDKGYYNVFVPMAELLHYESKSRGYDTTSSKFKRFQSEQEYMYKKWDKYIKHDPFYNPNFTLKYWFLLDI
ncbi:MAG: glycosyltransferase family 2 protein [Clostridia bacterium]|nr:glycosyltransferase family 2 protein [Clostridia bacterium]